MMSARFAGMPSAPNRSESFGLPKPHLASQSVATTTEIADAQTRAATALRVDRRAALAVAGIVLAGFVLYTGVAQLVETPRVHPDESIYGEGAWSLAEGDGISLRGDEYPYGPLYPALLAPVLALAGDRETGYALLKAVNALLFALVAVPVYLLARRLLPSRWSLAVAAGSLLVPSSMFVGLVMTEALAYLAAAWALLAIMLALERPTAVRQVAVLVAAVVAYTARPQLGALYGTYLLGLALVWLVVPGRLPRTRAAARAYWPTAASLLLAAAVFAVPLVGGSSPLGAYEVLWRSYDPLVVTKWFLYHLADLDLYLAVVPFAVAPIVLAGLVRRGRSGSAAAAAFAALVVAANVVGLAVVAVFASTEHGFDRLHDRNIFYLVPLWLLVLALWLAWGLPRPLLATVAGAVLALGLAAFLPFRYISAEVGVDVVPSALWARVQELADGSGRTVLGLAAVALVLAAALLPRRLWPVFPAAVAAALVATAVLAWERQIDAPENAVFEGAASNRSWIDEQLPADAHVTKLYLDSPSCAASGVTRHGLYLSEFFNGAVKRGAYIGDSIPDGLPIEQVNVGRDGTFVIAPGGQPLVADYVYTQPGIELEGRQLGTGTTAGLVLWQVDGPVRASRASSNAELRTRDCAYRTRLR
jgi:hypothetical protein